MGAIELHARASATFDAKLAETKALLQRAAADFAPITQASSLGAEDGKGFLDLREMGFPLWEMGTIQFFDRIPTWAGSANLAGAAGARFGRGWVRVTAAALTVMTLVPLTSCVAAALVPAWLGAVGVFLMNPAVTAFRYELPVLPASIVAVAVLVGQVARLAERHTARSASGTSRPTTTPAPAATGGSPASSNGVAP